MSDVPALSPGARHLINTRTDLNLFKTRPDAQAHQTSSAISGGVFGFGNVFCLRIFLPFLLDMSEPNYVLGVQLSPPPRPHSSLTQFASLRSWARPRPGVRLSPPASSAAPFPISGGMWRPGIPFSHEARGKARGTKEWAGMW